MECRGLDTSIADSRLLILPVSLLVCAWFAAGQFVTHYSTFVTFLSARNTAYFYILLPLQIVPIQAFYSYSKALARANRLLVN